MSRLLAGAALVAFLVALVVIVVASRDGGSGAAQTTAATTTARETTEPTEPTTTAPPPPKRVAVKLVGAGAYDPEGDGHEYDSLAPLAVDGDPATFWKTEHYTHGFFKKGVGLLLDAGRKTTFSRVVVGTDGGGSTALIEVGNSPTGPFKAVTPSRPLAESTTFTLKAGAAGRYLVVWITAIPAAVGETHITEVRASATLP